MLDHYLDNLSNFQASQFLILQSDHHKAHLYNLQLINSGVTRFTFHSIILQEVIDEEE